MKTKACIVTLILFFECYVSSAQSWNWVTGAGGSSYDIANDIYTDAGGNSYLTGWFQNTVDFGPDTLTSQGGYDIFVAKYNSSGICQWAIGIGSNSNDAGYGVISDTSGNVYVTGALHGTAMFGAIQLTSNGAQDVFVAAFNAAGVCQWATAGGSNQDDQGQAITLDHAGNIIVNGYFKSNAVFGAISLSVYGSSDAFTAKLNSSGTWLWVEKGGSTTGDNGYGVTTDANNNIYITGYFRSTATFGAQTLTATGMDDVYIVKYNSSGVCQWARKGAGSGDEHGNGIVADAAGNTYLTGWFTGGGMSFGSYNLTAAGTNEEIFVAKHDASGNPQWAVRAGSTSHELGTGICLDQSGNPVISASYQAAFTIGTTPLPSFGGQDVLAAKFSNTNGTNLWALSGGGSSSDYAYKISADGAGNIYTAGNFNGTCLFGTDSVTSQGIADIFVAKIDPGLSGIPESQNLSEMNIFPNPATESITVTAVEVIQFKLYNAMGGQVINQKLFAGKNVIPVTGLPVGIYFCKLSGKNGLMKTGKVVIQ